MLKRIFGQFTGGTFHLTFKRFVSSCSEHGNIVFQLSLKKVKITLERIQWQARKPVHGLKFKLFDKNLISLNLYPLMNKSIRGYLLLNYSTVNTSEPPLVYLLTLSPNKILGGNTP